MKVTPLAQGSGTLGVVDVSPQRTSPDRIAAAKAIAAGIKLTQPDTPADPQLDAIERSVRRIKMKTQVSPDRFDPTLTEAPTQTEPAPEVEESASTVTPDDTEQAKSGSEETKPLSPVLAEIARQKRALQRERREFEEQKAKLTGPNMDEYVSKADLQANPLKVFEAGVTYDKLTEAILGNQTNPEIQELRQELKALKEGVDKTFLTQQEQAEESALTEMLGQAEKLASEGEDYALVKQFDLYADVLNKIYTTYKKTGQVMEVTDALKFVEDKKFKELERLKGLKKVQSLWGQPEPTLQQQTNKPGMRTLTNRDGASRPMTARERAMAAFHGTLRK
jgi:hypothetical protein